LQGQTLTRNRVAGPDANIWFTEDFGNKIGQITATGVITEFSVPTNNSAPYSITVGPDGNLWFTEGDAAANKIGKITTAGVITEYPIPSPGGPIDIKTGADVSLWFTEGSANQIGKIISLRLRQRSQALFKILEMRIRIMILDSTPHWVPREDTSSI
jgi:virginiamycin B lyase